MFSSGIHKLAIIFTLVAAAVYAVESEKDVEQPEKLMGGILRNSEDCKYKISSNSEIKLHYRARAWGQDEFFENTYLDGEPHKFKLGRDKLMKGLEQGVHGMCQGEVRRLLIPANLAYGELGLPGQVPANTAVIYEVEAIHVNSPFSNPWFWSGVGALLLTYVFFNRLQNYLSSNQSAEFLQKKAAEKKSE